MNYSELEKNVKRLKFSTFLYKFVIKYDTVLIKQMDMHSLLHLKPCKHWILGKDLNCHRTGVKKYVKHYDSDICNRDIRVIMNFVLEISNGKFILCI